MDAYEALKEILLDGGLTVVQEQRHPEAFGSAWAVFEARGRKVRLVWDGKDGWGFVQTEGADPGEWIDHGPRVTRDDLASARGSSGVAAFRAAVRRLGDRDSTV